jgi:hypothetical protein
LFGVHLVATSVVPYSNGIAQAFNGQIIEYGIVSALLGIVLGVLTEMRPPEKS